MEVVVLLRLHQRRGARSSAQGTENPHEVELDPGVKSYGGYGMVMMEQLQNRKKGQHVDQSSVQPHAIDLSFVSN
ncbi:hypothetical protein ABZP36_012158 [Zizania latifolia]